MTHAPSKTEVRNQMQDLRKQTKVLCKVPTIQPRDKNKVEK